MSLYAWLKGLHVTFVSLSLALFLLRGWWRWRGSSLRDSHWATRVPHVNDTLLLLAGLSLAGMLGWNPLSEAWLQAKLAGLVLHVLLAVVALKARIGRLARGAAWAGSLAAFIYVVAVALARDSLPWS